MKAENKKNMGAALKRLVAYILKRYKWQCLLVALCILVSTVANIGGTLFMRNLIDDYILPFVNQVQPDLTPLLRALFVMAAVYYIGVFCTWAYNFIMIYEYSYAGAGQSGICKLCGDCNGGGVPVYLRRAYDTGDAGILPAILTLFQSADFTAFTAVEFYHYGDCGGREDFWTIG